MNHLHSNVSVSYKSRLTSASLLPLHYLFLLTCYPPWWRALPSVWASRTEPGFVIPVPCTPPSSLSPHHLVVKSLPSVELLSSSLLSFLLVIASGALSSQEDFSGQNYCPSLHAAYAWTGLIKVGVPPRPCLSFLPSVSSPPLPASLPLGSLLLFLPPQALGMYMTGFCLVFSLLNAFTPAAVLDLPFHFLLSSLTAGVLTPSPGRPPLRRLLP